MHSEELEAALISISDKILAKSQAGDVHWQTVGGEPANYHVHFGDGTSFIVYYRSSEESGAVAMISLKIGAVIAARIEAQEGDDNFERFQRLFQEAHRAASGWDKAIQMIQERIASGESLGDPAGNIPI